MRPDANVHRARESRAVPRPVLWPVLAGVLLLPACASAPSTQRASQRAAAGERAVLERRTRLVETATGSELALADVVARLARAEAVFFGETHLDETTHALELAVYAGLIEATGGRVVLAMEMFARDAQPALDAYLAGNIDEAEFLARSEPWGNYRTGYRPLIELAKAHGLPVVGSNVPADLRRRVSQGEAAAFAALSDEERRLIAPELLPNSAAYWERFRRIVRGPADQTLAPADYLHTGQSLWDNTMGFSCAEALEARPGWLVLHVNGRFHSDYGQGVVDQLRLRRPGTRVATITATSVEDAAGLEFGGVAPEADFVAFVEARGRGLQDGYHAVRTAHAQRFRLHVPAGASDASPAPLLIWLTRDGVSAHDELEFWRVALGDEAAVAALEPTYRGLAADLGPGGTWIHVETASEDVGDALAAVRDARRYLERYFPVDPERVLVAGAGTGGTVAAAGALTGEFESAAAFEPAAFRRLRTWGLPEDGGPARTLRVVCGDEDREWWTQELEDYRPSGLAGNTELASQRSVVCQQLSLGAPEDPSPIRDGFSDPPGNGQPRHDLWSATQEFAQQAGRRVVEHHVGELQRLPLDLASGAVSGRVLPVPAGPFGGTTVIVVPEGEVGPVEREGWRAAWQALDGSDVLSPHGGSHRLRVAIQGGSPSPATVLAELRRKNVLIVPATFCASADEMRALREEIAPQLVHLTHAFLPGLGGRLHLAGEE